MHDGDRSNNAITLMIDEDYFRPDYTIGFNAIEWASSGVTVTCIAKNVGPENGSACFVRLTVNDVSAYQQLMSSLEVAQSTQLIFEPTDLSLSLLGAETELRLKVDHYDGVDENDETNNEALAWVSRGGSLDPVLQRFEWIGPSVAEPLRIDPMFLDEIERMLDLIDGYLVDPWVSRYPGGNGPIIELPEAWLVEVRTGERILVVLNQPLFTRAEKLFSTLVR